MLLAIFYHIFMQHMTKFQQRKITDTNFPIKRDIYLFIIMTCFCVLVTEAAINNVVTLVYQIIICIYINHLILVYTHKTLRRCYGLAVFAYFNIRYLVATGQIVENIVLVVLFTGLSCTLFFRQLHSGEAAPKPSEPENNPGNFIHLLFKDLLQMIPSTVLVMDQHKEPVYLNNDVPSQTLNIKSQESFVQ